MLVASRSLQENPMTTGCQANGKTCATSPVHDMHLRRSSQMSDPIAAQS